MMALEWDWLEDSSGTQMVEEWEYQGEKSEKVMVPESDFLAYTWDSVWGP